MKYLFNGQSVPHAGTDMLALPNGAAGVFETLRVRNGRPLFWSEHWSRFEAGARHHEFSPPLISMALQRVAEGLIEENGIREGVLRYATWREPDGGIAWRAETSGPRPMMLRPELRVTWGPTLEDGGPDRAYKHLQRTAWAAAVHQARANGFDEALLTNARGDLLEAGTANVFIVSGGTVATPPLSLGPLPGILRAEVIAVAKQAGLTVNERPIARRELESADEVWLTNSLIGIRPVSAVDGRAFRSERPMLRRTVAAWSAYHGWDPTT